MIAVLGALLAVVFLEVGMHFGALAEVGVVSGGVVVALAWGARY